MIPACIKNADVYAARIPRKNQYYRCVEAHFEELVGKWDDRYQQDYGYWRPYILDVIYKYLDCAVQIKPMRMEGLVTLLDSGGFVR